MVERVALLASARSMALSSATHFTVHPTQMREAFTRRRQWAMPGRIARIVPNPLDQGDASSATAVDLFPGGREVFGRLGVERERPREDRMHELEPRRV